MRHILRPLFDRVVVKELEPDRIRQSGLLVPAGTHEPPPQHGIVLAVGPGLDWWESAGITMPVKPGDHVVFPASARARGWRSTRSGCWSAASASCSGVLETRSEPSPRDEDLGDGIWRWELRHPEWHPRTEFGAEVGCYARRTRAAARS